MIDSASWLLARAYARCYGLVKDLTGRNLPGLGRVLRLLRRTRTFRARGLTFAFDPRLATAYGRLVADAWNEPETHLFLRHVLDHLRDPVQFVDVGANVGEVLLDAARHAQVAQAIGYEPDPRTAANLRESVRLNRTANVEVREAAVADGRAAAFVVDETYPVLSRLDLDASVPRTGGSARTGDSARTVRLDEELDGVSGALIVLIDAEGAELLVLQGMPTILATRKPLVIFEYNDLGKGTYGLEAVRALLGPAYRIHRLRVDGLLDDAYEQAWNCVAIPLDSEFQAATRSLLRSP